MSDDEDDFMSDKFLVESSKPSQSKTYTEKREEASRKAQQQSAVNRTKSRREAREEGLRKSLFERAKEEEEQGVGTANKALNMMMKMGFKPGQGLGNSDESKTEPLPINEWIGKKGIGLGKRARSRSPTSKERIAKMAKMAESTSQETFRDRTREDYHLKKTERQLVPALRTLVSLDKDAEKEFNILWLNPSDPDSFPPGLLGTLYSETSYVPPDPTVRNRLAHEQLQLRKQMQADALQPLTDDQESNTIDGSSPSFSEDVVLESNQYLRLKAPDRLNLVVSYLRDNYAYCFYCGTQYKSQDELEAECPGEDEESHD